MTEKNYHVATNLATLRMARRILGDVFIADSILPIKPELQEKLRQAFVTIDELTDVYYKACRR